MFIVAGADAVYARPILNQIPLSSAVHLYILHIVEFRALDMSIGLDTFRALFAPATTERSAAYQFATFTVSNVFLI